jgi:polyisoprenoid-binding protein YceI
LHFAEKWCIDHRTEHRNADVGSIDATTINTREAQRDAHLKSADFLDVANFPVLTFKSTEISKNVDGSLAVGGDLTIRGVTRPVVLDVEEPSAPQKDPWGNRRIGFSASTKIYRKNFGLVWNAALETGGILVGEEVAISLEVEFVHQIMINPCRTSF